MDIFTPNYIKALKMQRDRCGGKSAQRERDQLMEEAGEVISVMGRMSRGRSTRHDFASEAADVVICIAALLERHGFSEEEFQKILDAKTRKWLASEERMNAPETCPECGEEAGDDCLWASGGITSCCTCWQNEEDAW